LQKLDPALPGIAPSVLDYHARSSEIDWANRQEVIDYQVGAWQLLNGSAHSFDESMIRQLAAADFDRTPNLMTTFNHALLQGGDKWFNRLDEITAPTLVVHGTEDLVLPYVHGLALQAEIPNTVLLTLPGTGHELHRDDWSVIIEAIQQHTVV
jgi:pimeloyl-ACP methyl ester carboxylesterase